MIFELLKNTKKNDSDLFEKISRSSMQLLQSSCSNTDSGDAPPWNRFIDKNFTKLISSIHSDFFCWKFPRILLTFPKNYKDSIIPNKHTHEILFNILYICVFYILFQNIPTKDFQFDSLSSSLTAGSSPYCLSYNSCDVISENLVLDQLIISKLIFFFILITCLLNIVLTL